MFRQNRQAIEEPLAHSIGFRQLENDRSSIDFAYGDWLPIDNQEVALRSVHAFIEVHMEAEEHVIGIQGLAVGKLESLPKHDGVLEPIGRDFPGLGKRRFRKLRGAIDMNKVGLHDADDFTRAGIRSDQGIQCLWLAPQCHDETAARLARFSRYD
jgi:hypothetical protein